MSVLKSLKCRKSVRAFLPNEIPSEIFELLFDAVRWCPSSKNTQPWKVVVISGEKKKQLTTKILSAFENGIKPEMEYNYDGDMKLEGELRNRAVACGKAMYDILDIKKEDKEKRMSQWKQNYVSFDSPSMILIFKNNNIGDSGYIDCGMLLQSIMLAADELGLATCPQASLAQYPEIIKNEIGYHDYTLICGVAIGFEDKSAPINNYRTAREDVEDFVEFLD